MAHLKKSPSGHLFKKGSTGHLSKGCRGCTCAECLAGTCRIYYIARIAGFTGCCASFNDDWLMTKDANPSVCSWQHNFDTAITCQNGSGNDVIFDRITIDIFDPGSGVLVNAQINGQEFIFGSPGPLTLIDWNDDFTPDDEIDCDVDNYSVPFVTLNGNCDPFAGTPTFTILRA